MDRTKAQQTIEPMLNNLAELLRSKGRSEQEINQTIVALVTEVEMAVVDEIVASLPEDKQKQLAAIKEDQPLEEIANLLDIDQAQMDAIELRKIDEIVAKFAESLDAA